MNPRLRNRQTLPDSFEVLMATRHGAAAPELLRPVNDIRALLAGYHGAMPGAAAAQSLAVPRVSVMRDDGRALQVRQVSRHAVQHDAQGGAGSGRAGTMSEAGVMCAEGSHPRIGPPSATPDASSEGGVAAAPTAPVVTAAAPDSTLGNRPLLPNANAELPTDPIRAALGTGAVAPATSSANSPANSPARRPDAAPAAAPETAMSENDLMAELEAIVKGQSVYDPARKKTVPRDALKEYPRDEAAASPPPAAPAGLGAAGDSQAIFDRITQSMQHAGAYDLGTVELENRFADFDRLDEKRSAPKPRAAAPVPGTSDANAPRERTATAPPADTSDFIHDLDAIHGTGPVVAKSASVGTGYARPLYDTGEHVLPGIDLYRDQLTVGAAPGVAFSYGQLIAMADLFGSVDEMMAAQPPQLSQIKTLIEQNTLFYQGRGGSDVSNDKWQEVTFDNYLKLAEENYDHFAPNLLFPAARFVAAAAQHRDHRQAWQAHHERALGQVQPGTSGLPALPLTINAFGDHFLTDAFAAGHLVNKAALIEMFKANFYTGKALSAAGNAFFDRVAQQAWKGELARKFTQLETAKPYDAWWNIVKWHPDINDAGRFASVLQQAAVQAPEKVANLVVKAIHDVLNQSGFEVENDAGQRWHLTGDGHLTAETLAVMKRAVTESAQHIVDAASGVAMPPLAALYAKVWAHVPRPTAGATTVLHAVVKDYLAPTSAALTHAAAEILNKQYETLIKELLKRKALRRID
jgi:hypothetical protein